MGLLAKRRARLDVDACYRVFALMHRQGRFADMAASELRFLDVVRAFDDLEVSTVREPPYRPLGNDLAVERAARANPERTLPP